MGRPPCCDKAGVKKGPWTPEEDIMLVSYVQEHGPGNWRSVPTLAGLKRCSKSCRLRWTNYLRPGIKRGTFTDQEEKMIIQLQALLGNKWAAIASYLPERTDNDIKNYWNTHLKKKLKKLENRTGDQTSTDEHSSSASSLSSVPRGQWERRLRADINTAKRALQDALSVEETNNFPEFLMPCNTKVSLTKPAQTAPYASSTENIARLLKEWVKTAPKSDDSKCLSADVNSISNSYAMAMESSCSGEILAEERTGVDLSGAFESLFGFESFGSSDSDDFSRSTSPTLLHTDTKSGPTGFGPLSVLENWLLDDQGKDCLENFSIFDENPNLF